MDIVNSFKQTLSILFFCTLYLSYALVLLYSLANWFCWASSTASMFLDTALFVGFSHISVYPTRSTVSAALLQNSLWLVEILVLWILSHQRMK